MISNSKYCSKLGTRQLFGHYTGLSTNKRLLNYYLIIETEEKTNVETFLKLDGYVVGVFFNEPCLVTYCTNFIPAVV